MEKSNRFRHDVLFITTLMRLGISCSMRAYWDPQVGEIFFMKDNSYGS